jgi:hypothetical protein
MKPVRSRPNQPHLVRQPTESVRRGHQKSRFAASGSSTFYRNAPCISTRITTISHSAISRVRPGGSSLRKRDIPQMDVQQRISCRNPEHFRPMDCLPPPLVQQTAVRRSLCITIQSCPGSRPRWCSMTMPHRDSNVFRRDLSMSRRMAEPESSRWTYTPIVLHDGDRILEPTHISFDRVFFRAPPRLTSNRIAIVISNGRDEFRSVFDVLPPETARNGNPYSIRKSVTASNVGRRVLAPCTGSSFRAVMQCSLFPFAWRRSVPYVILKLTALRDSVCGYEHFASR